MPDRWEQRVADSSAKTAAVELKASIEQGGAADADEQGFLDRSLRVVEQVLWVLDNADPTLVSDSTLSELGARLVEARAYLDQWRGGAGPEFLSTHVQGQLDLVAVALSQVLMPASAAEAASEVASLRRSIGQHRGQVEREMEALAEARTAMEARVTEAIAAADQRVEDLTAELGRLNAEIAQGVAAARDLATTQQSTFSSDQTDRQETFARLLEEKRQELTDASAQLQSTALEQASAFEKATKANLATANAAKERVEEILEIVSEEALVGTYSKYATDEKTEANVWRWIATIAIAASVFIGFSLLAGTDKKGSDWDAFAAKAALALPFGAVAAYAAKQSGEHRTAQRDAQHVALQLAALKPFLKDLEKEGERDRLLAITAEKIFGQPRVHPGADDPPFSALADNPAALSQLLSVLLKAATK